VTLSSTSLAAVTVDYTTADGTAVSGDDYQPRSGEITITPGTLAQTIEVAVNGDTALERDETFFVDLLSADNAPIADSRGVGTITNDDALCGASLVPDGRRSSLEVAAGGARSFLFETTLGRSYSLEVGSNAPGPAPSSRSSAAKTAAGRRARRPIATSRVSRR